MEDKEGAERPFYDEVLDYVVYAPIGVAIRVAGALPDFVREGRARLGGTMQMANAFGRLAVGQLRRQFDQDVHAPPSTHHEAGEREDSALALSGYDDLAASEIVSRLSGCSVAELRAIAEYERTHRNRRTILNRITQLAEDPGTTR